MTFLLFSILEFTFDQVHGAINQIVFDLEINLVEIFLLYSYHSFLNLSTTQDSFALFK